MNFTCPSGLVGQLRNIKGHELSQIAEQADSDATPSSGISTIVGGCWEKTIDSGPYVIAPVGDTKPQWPRILKGDLIYLLLRLRAASVKTPNSDAGPWGPGDPYYFDVTCQACRHRYAWEIKLSDLKLKTLSDASRNTLADPAGVFEATVDGVRYTFALQTISLDEPIIKLRKQQKRSSATVVDQLTAQTLTISTLKNSDNIRARWNHIVDLDAWKLQELQDAYEAADCGIDTELETKCTVATCRYVQEVELPLGKSFFRPKKPKAEGTDPAEDEPTSLVS